MHRVAAAAGTRDDQLAEDLAVAAARAEAEALGRAARYRTWSWRVDGRVRRGEASLFEAVRLMLITGDVRGAQECADAVAARPPGPWRSFLLTFLVVIEGRFEPALHELRAQAEALTPAQYPELSGYCQALLGLVCASLGLDEEAQRWAGRSRQVPGRPPGAEALAVQAITWSSAKSGRLDSALRLLDERRAAEPESGPFATELLTVRGVLRNWAGDHPGAVEDLAVVLDRQHQGGPAMGITHAHIALAEAQFRLGDWDRAATRVELAISLGEDLGHPWFLAYARAVATFLYAARGDDGFAEAHAVAAQQAAAAAPSVEALGLRRARAGAPRVGARRPPGRRGRLGAARRGAMRHRGGLPEPGALAPPVGRGLPAHRTARPGARADVRRPGRPWGGITLADRARLAALAAQVAGRTEEAVAILAAAMPDPEPTSRRLADGQLALEHGRLLLALKHRNAAVSSLLTGRAVLAGLGATLWSGPVTMSCTAAA